MPKKITNSILIAHENIKYHVVIVKNLNALDKVFENDFTDATNLLLSKSQTSKIDLQNKLSARYKETLPIYKDNQRVSELSNAGNDSEKIMSVIIKYHKELSDKDITELEELAKKGHVLSHYDLGFHYMNQNSVKCIEHFLYAHKGGNLNALFNLARFFGKNGNSTAALQCLLISAYGKCRNSTKRMINDVTPELLLTIPDLHNVLEDIDYKLRSRHILPKYYLGIYNAKIKEWNKSYKYFSEAVNSKIIDTTPDGKEEYSLLMDLCGSAFFELFNQNEQLSSPGSEYRIPPLPRTSINRINDWLNCD